MRKSMKNFWKCILSTVFVVLSIAAFSACDGEQEPPLHEHTASDWCADGEKHWQVCTDCGETVTEAPHEITSLTVNELPIKTQYRSYEQFETQGLLLSGECSCGPIALNGEDYTIAYQTAGAENLRSADTQVFLCYGELSVPVSVSVSKIAVQKPVADDRQFTYNGEAQTYSIAQNPDYLVSGATQTNAGEYEVIVTLSDKAETVWADGASDDLIYDFKVQKADYDMTGVAFENQSVPFDGKPHSLIATGLPIGLDGIALTARYEGAATNVADGVVTVTAKFATTSQNYRIPADMTATLVITPVEAETVWERLESYLYTGKTLPSPAAKTVDVNGEEIPLAVSGDSIEGVGEYSYTATLNDSNYTLTNTKCKIVVKAYNTVSVIVRDISCGETPAPQAEAKERGEFTYLYAREETGEYGDLTEFTQGVYFVKATVADTGYYLSATSSPVAFEVSHDYQWKKEAERDIQVCACTHVNDNTIVKTKLSARKEINLELSVQNGVVLPSDSTVTLDLSEVGAFESVATVFFANQPIAENTAEIALKDFGFSYGEQTLLATVKTSDGELHEISVPVLLVSKVLKTAEDYSAFVTVSKACEQESSLWGGYFRLGNSFSVASVGELLDSAAMDGTQGFCGVFDGCGYTLDGFQKSGEGAFFLTLHERGVLKNISFTGVCFGGSGALLTSGKGSCENIFVQYAEIAGDGEDCATFGAGVSLKNCLVDGANAAYHSISFSLIGAENAENAYAIFPDGYVAGNEKAFSCYADMQGNAEVQTAIAAWGDFWSVKNGLPVPTALYREVYERQPLSVQGFVESIFVGQSFTLAANLHSVTIAASNGGEVLGWTVTVPETVAAGTQITVKVCSVYDKTVSVSYTVLVKKKIDVTLAMQDIDLRLSAQDGIVSLSNEYAEIPFGGQTDELGEIYEASLRSGALDPTNVKAEKGVLSLPLSLFGTAYGEETLTVIGENGKIVAPITLVSLSIKTVDDYNAFGAVAYALGNREENTWDGYFTLGANLSQEGGIELNEFIDISGLAKDGTNGFKGNFDGRGYTIDGLIVNSVSGNAFISVLHKEGIIRNIGFTNAVFRSSTCSFVVSNGRGTVENIYVQYAEIGEVSTALSGTFYLLNKISDCFIDASNAKIVYGDSVFRLIGMTQADGAAGVYCVYPSAYTPQKAYNHNLSDFVNAFASTSAMLSNTAASTEINTWNSKYWRVQEGALVFGRTS